jgi:hypothetical protein
MVAMCVTIIGAALGIGAPVAAALGVQGDRGAQADRPAPSTQSAGGAAVGSLGIRLLDIPADATDDPRAHQYIVDSLQPGTTIQRRIEISNGTAGPLTIAVYPGAAKIEDGSFIGAAPGSQNTLSSRTGVNEDRLLIGAGQSAIDTVTVTIPSDAAPGESYAEVWAQVASPGRGISLAARVGIRLYLNVQGNNAPEADFTITTMTALRNDRKQPVVTAMVHNTGGRAIDLSGTLRLSIVSGSLNAGPYDAEIGTTLAPGQSEAVTILPTDALDNGPWNATLEMQSGLLHKSYQAKITFPSTQGKGSIAAAHPSSDMTASLLYIIGGLVLLALVAVSMWIAIARRRPRGTGASGSMPHSPQRRT